ncbi:MAG TPA: hypothetical protein VIG82_09145 [Enteractinococcus sp.]
MPSTRLDHKTDLHPKFRRAVNPLADDVSIIPISVAKTLYGFIQLFTMDLSGALWRDKFTFINFFDANACGILIEVCTDETGVFIEWPDECLTTGDMKISIRVVSRVACLS